MQQNKREGNKSRQDEKTSSQASRFVSASRKSLTRGAGSSSHSKIKKNVWSKIKNSIQDKSLFTKFSIELEHEREWQTVDMGKIISDSWDLEKADLSKSLELDITPDFFTPKRQVEQLEKTS